MLVDKEMADKSLTGRLIDSGITMWSMAPGVNKYRAHTFAITMPEGEEGANRCAKNMSNFLQKIFIAILLSLLRGP